MGGKGCQTNPGDHTGEALRWQGSRSFRPILSVPASRSDFDLSTSGQEGHSSFDFASVRSRRSDVQYFHLQRARSGDRVHSSDGLAGVDEHLRGHPHRYRRPCRSSFSCRHLCRPSFSRRRQRRPNTLLACHTSCGSARSSLSAERSVGECLDDIATDTYAHMSGHVCICGARVYMHAGVYGRAQPFPLSPFVAQGSF